MEPMGKAKYGSEFRLLGVYSSWPEVFKKLPMKNGPQT